MKKNFFRNFVFLISMFGISLVHAQESILIVNAQGPTQSMTPQVFRLIEEANRIQNRYKFVSEFKPGGFESIGIKSMLASPNNQLVTVTNSMMESVDRGFINLEDVTPVFSFGDACWAVITNFGNSDRGLDSIIASGVKEITVGGPAIGGAAHLVALQIGRRYNIPVRYIVYRSNYDALINMAADDKSVNMVMDRLISYEQISGKNPKLQALAVNCPERVPAFANIKTLKEQKIDAPYIWHFVLASNQMPMDKRKDIESIFNKAAMNIGKSQLFATSDFVSPLFLGVTSQQHYDTSVTQLKNFRLRYAKEIKNPN